MFAQSDYAVVGTIDNVLAFDSDGTKLNEENSRSGADSNLQFVYSVKIDRKKVLKTTGGPLPDTIQVYCWQGPILYLTGLKQLIGESWVFLVKRDNGHLVGADVGFCGGGMHLPKEFSKLRPPEDNMYDSIENSGYVVLGTPSKVFGRNGAGTEIPLPKVSTEPNSQDAVVFELTIDPNGIIKSSLPALSGTVEVEITGKVLGYARSMDNVPPVIPSERLARLKDDSGIYLLKRHGDKLAPTVNAWMGGFYFSAAIRDRIAAIAQHRPEPPLPRPSIDNMVPNRAGLWQPDAAGLIARNRAAEIVMHRERESLANTFRPMLNGCQLSPQQRGRIEQVWGEENSKARLAIIAAVQSEAKRIDASDAGRRVRSDTEAEIATILGPTGTERLAETREMFRMAFTVEEFGYALDDYGLPALSEEQSWKLNRVLTQSVPQLGRGMQAPPLGPDLLPWEVLIEQLSATLLLPVQQQVWTDERPWRGHFQRAPAEETHARRLTSRHERVHQYRDTIFDLGLSNAKLEQLKDLLGDHAVLSQQQPSASVDPRIVALVGPGHDEQLKSADMLSWTRIHVDSTYGPAMAYAHVPLTNQQTHQLTLAIFELEKPTRKYPFVPFHPDYRAGPPDWLADEDKTLIARASTFLSPVQLAVLKQHEAEHNEFYALMSVYPKLDVGAIPASL